MLRCARMEGSSGVELHMEASSDGGLKELVLRWFTDTQAPLLLSSGNFPDWFQGFAARRDAEDLLRDKALGSFLIRLSDKAIGYILSYKGHDRCRHFVITQDRDGHFVVSGDCQTHRSLTELIEHYKGSPIQPFGEYLTSSCYEVNAGELYDVVNFNPEAKTGVSVQALRLLWDQKNNQHSDPGSNQSIQPQTESPAAQPPALPHKSKTRKLTGTVSVDTVLPSQSVPPVPKRGFPLGFSLSGSLPETTSHPSEAQTDLHRSEPLRCDRDSLTSTSSPGDLCPPGVTYSELMQVASRSKSLPRLNKNNMEEEEEEEEEEEYSSKQSYSPTPTRRVTGRASPPQDPRDGSRSEQQGDDPDVSRSNPLYQTAKGPGGGPAPPGDGMYAEVSQRPTPAWPPSDTYEEIPGEDAAPPSNTYESLEDMKNKKSKTTWGKKNVKWKKFLPDYKKK